MAKTYYLPKDDAGKDGWLTNLAAQAPTYSTDLSLSIGDVASLGNDAPFYHWTILAQEQVAAYAQAWTAYKNKARNGTGPTMGTVPVPPILPPMPTAVPPGIFGRTAALVGRMKKATGYTEVIGQTLQIIGADQTVDVNALKPILTVALVAGQVAIGWTKQGMDSIEIEVDRGEGFVFLAIDTVPGYTDTAAMPAAGQSALWKYKAIYRLNDERVGQWSDVVSLPVAG